MKTLIALLSLIALAVPVDACTGITLRSKDGAVIFARTLEWGTFDLQSRVGVIPEGTEFTSTLADDVKGITWKAAYSAVGFDIVGKNHIFEGMNNQGLAINLFYHPGFAQYPEADPNELDVSLEPLDLTQYLLTTCKNIEEVREVMEKIKVVNVVEPILGFPVPMHHIVTEPSGKSLVIEFGNKEVQLFDAPLGVLTNSPNYDWHLTNLRNYINLSAVALPGKNIAELDFTPLGGGSGMIGIPGDFTPPSRFVRAVAFSQSARPTDTARETMYEIFRILDNFNVPVSAAEGDDSGEGDAPEDDDIRSATQFTSAFDTKNRIIYYHTMDNRRVRMIDLKAIDFSKAEVYTHFPLDEKKEQDIDDVTPLQ